jgi:hypothetical protein
MKYVIRVYNADGKYAEQTVEASRLEHSNGITRFFGDVQPDVKLVPCLGVIVAPGSATVVVTAVSESDSGSGES